jgi:CheY-like chemotaxis protein
MSYRATSEPSADSQSRWISIANGPSRLMVLDREAIVFDKNDAKDSGHGRSPDDGPDQARLRICVLEPDPEQLRGIAAVLRTMGHEVLAIDQVIGASNQIRAFNPDLLISETQTPTLSGPVLLQVLRRNLPVMPILIIYSDFEPEELARIAKQAGADDFVPKREGITALASKVRYQFELAKHSRRGAING